MFRKNQKLRYINKKPNLVILFNKGKLLDYPLNTPQYLQSYRDFFRLAQSKFNIFIVRGKRYYLGQGSFFHGYLFGGGRLKKFNNKIRAKIIYNKGDLYSNGGKNWHIINRQGLRKLAEHKFTTYKSFKKICKSTYLIKSKDDFKKYIKRIKTKKVVFKPALGFEGRGIMISNKSALLKKIKKFDGLLQEFLDTSKGIPNICPSQHDLRVLIMNGKIVQAYVRIPKKGSLLANVAQGGRLKEIRIKSIPGSALKIVNHIDNQLKKFGDRIYSIDLGFENNKPYLFEINDRPGLPYKKWKMYYNKWHRALLRTLLKAAAS